LPKTIESFHQTFPTIAVNLFDLSCGEQFHALEEGKLDLGFVGLHEPIARRGLEFRTIASYRSVVALPKENPLTATTKAAVSLKALAPMFFIGMSETSYPGYREWLIRTCGQCDFTPKVLQDVDLERKMIHAVAAGLGVAIVPEQLTRLEHEGVVFRPLDPVIMTEGCVAWRDQNPSSALQAYIQIVEQAGSSLR
jgi:DNA-binding transcriptional LysR family regulator